MKITILLGYANSDGTGTPIVVNEFDAAKQGKIFDDAKRLHVFPKGIKHLAFGTFLPTTRASFISEESAKAIQSDAKASAARLEFAAKVREAEAKIETTRQAIKPAKLANRLAADEAERLSKAVANTDAAKNAEEAKEIKAKSEAANKNAEKAAAALVAAEKAHSDAVAALETLTKPTTKPNPTQSK